MKRLIGFLLVGLLLGTAYWFSRIEIAPEIRLDTKAETVKKEKAEPSEVKVEAVNWPDEKPVPRKPKPRPAKPQTKTVKRETAPAMPPKTAVEPAGQASHEGFDILGRFECSVEDYLRVMRSRGALVVAYDHLKQRFLGISANDELSVLKGFPAGYSSLTRRLTDDYPKSHHLLERVAVRWGPGTYDILLILPQALDRQLEQNIRQSLKGLVPVEQVSRVDVSYRSSREGLVMYLESAYLGAKSIPIGQTLPL